MINSKRKIIIVTDNYDSLKGGGAGVIANSHSKFMSQNGFDIVVLTTTDNENSEGESYEGDIRVFKIYSKYNIKYRSYVSIYNPAVIPKAKSFFKKENADIVHFHNIHIHLSYHSIYLAKLYSKSVFLTVHDSMPFHYSKLYPSTVLVKGDEVLNYKVNFLKQIKDFRFGYNPFRNILIKYYFSKLDKIFSVSNELNKALEDNGIHNVETVHNGIDINSWSNIDQFQRSVFTNLFEEKIRDKKVIFFGGRLSNAKGFKTISNVLNKINSKDTKVVVLAVGESDERIGDLEYIIPTGFIPHDSIRYLYEMSDIVMVPSKCFDWFPTVVLEAMIMSKPVIVTCFGGSKEMIIDGVNGYIVNPEDENCLIEKVNDLINNKEKSDLFGKNGFERVIKDFSTEKQMNSLLLWYDKEN